MTINYEEAQNYFWNLNKNQFGFEKNIYDCRIHISLYKENRAVFCFMSKHAEILFAEFRRVKITPEFAAKITRSTNKLSMTKTIVIHTSNFDKQTLVDFLLSAKGGNTTVNDAFDKFVCSWL